MTADNVTVPREAVRRLILAADVYGVRYLDSDDLSDEAQELQDATEAMKDLLAAPSVPSPVDQGAFAGAHTQPGGADGVVSDLLWSWYASPDEEQYRVGPCASREEAIEVATEDFDGEPFHVVEACKGSMAAFLPTGQRIIEWMTECADDNGAFGEDDYCELTGSADAIAAAEADAKAVLSAWFARHAALFPTPWAFQATRNGEWVMPALQADADPADGAA